MTAPPARILRHPDFRRLWVADVLSQLGMIAIPLLAVLDLNASALQVSLLRTCETAARLLFGLVAGAWIDRVRSLPVMVWADLARALLFGSIPAAAAFNVLTLALLYGVLVLVGLLTVLFNVAHSSYPPRLLAILGAVVHRTLDYRAQCPQLPVVGALAPLDPYAGAAAGTTGATPPTPRDQRWPPLVFRHPIGLLSMVGLLGAIAASAFTERLSRLSGPGWRLGWYVAATLLAGISIIVAYILQISARQLLCPPDLQGRVSATMSFVTWGAAPLRTLRDIPTAEDLPVRR